MNKTKLSWTVNIIEKMADQKMTLSFDHPIQRKSEIWTDQQKSLLIHSLLANYPIPHIYVLREDSQETDKNGKPIFSYYVMDGKQRLTSTLSYIYGEFALSENIPNIKIEDEEYELAGKYFVDLHKDVQYEIRHYKFDIIAFEECTNREIEEIFLRLNNGSALTKSQIAKAKAGVEIAVLLNKLLASKFIKEICFFTKSQIAKSEDQKCILQAMMLLDRNYVPNFTFKDFSEQEITEYAESLNGNYTEKQADAINSALEFLSNAFSEKNKNLKKISVPMTIYLANYAIDHEISPRQFAKWYVFFTEKDEFYADFKFFGGTGSTKLEKVDARLAIMAKSFCKYNKLDLPEELADIIDKTDKLLEERKAMLAGAENTVLSEQEKDTSIADQVGNDSLVIVEEESETSDTVEQEESVTSEDTETFENETVLTETSENETDNAEQEEITASEETDNADSAEEEIFTEENLQNAE